MSGLWENSVWFPVSRGAAGHSSGHTAWQPGPQGAARRRGVKGASALSVSTSQGTEGARLDGEGRGGGAPTSQGQNCKGDKKARPGREEESGM